MLYNLTAVLSGLPRPETLGPYTAYVAWLAEPLLGAQASPGSAREVRDYADQLRWGFRAEQKLGLVGNSATTLGPIGLDKFLVLISAETSGAVSERRGPLLFRGYSPSTRLWPGSHNMLYAGVQLDPDRLPFRQELRPAHAHHAGWVMPPPNPAAPVIMGREMLVPAVAPFLPASHPRDNLRPGQPQRVVKLSDGDTLQLEARPILRTIGGKTFVMYGFNGQYPGPLIDVPQNAKLNVKFTNQTDLPSSVHWHGVRVANQYDGTPGVTQDLVLPGGTFWYQVSFRDAGLYWYHPHHREDIEQDLGLYGSIIVRSPRPQFFGPANREAFLMVDDLLIGEDGLFPYGLEAPTHALMGRFGNVFLINGEPHYRLSVRAGEVVRFFLTNVSNARTFNISFGNLPLKIVGSDVGKFEHEAWSNSVVIAPAERYIVEVQFREPGTVPMMNRVRAVNHLFGTFYAAADTLGVVSVQRGAVSPDYSTSHKRLRTNSDVITDIDRYRGYFDRPPDHTLLLTLEPSQLPAPLLQGMQWDSLYFDPIEWDRTMPMMNWVTTSRNVKWVLRDRDSGRENMDIRWRFKVGDVVKIRLHNDRSGLHAMQHPIHLHGQRFLVVAYNGVRNPNLVWKDTVLLPVGATVDILVEISNPGKWMMHCHIAEHLGAGMMLVFEATDS